MTKKSNLYQTRPCVICGNPMKERFSAIFLRKYESFYDQCEFCEFIKVRDPNWYDEAYDNAICLADTGIVSRNLTICNALTALLPILDRNGRYLDYGGGVGLLVRLMRDRGFKFYWHDNYARNDLARGFEYIPELGPCTAVTALEVLEHVEDPVDFVTRALSAGNSDTFIFSTVLFHGSQPPSDWWYYARDAGQHVSFYSRRTLQALASRIGARFISNGWLHMLTTRTMNETIFRLALSRPSRIFAALRHTSHSALALQDHLDMIERERILRDANAISVR